MKELTPVDAIVQHNKDGTITPLRIRIETEDGLEEYTMKGAKEVEHGTSMSPDGIFVTALMRMYEAYAVVRGQKLMVRLYEKDGIWSVAM